jgi:hypothetical protein
VAERHIDAAVDGNVDAALEEPADSDRHDLPREMESTDELASAYRSASDDPGQSAAPKRRTKGVDRVVRTVGAAGYAASSSSGGHTDVASTVGEYSLAAPCISPPPDALHVWHPDALSSITGDASSTDERDAAPLHSSDASTPQQHGRTGPESPNATQIQGSTTPDTSSGAHLTPTPVKSAVQDARDRKAEREAAKKAERETAKLFAHGARGSGRGSPLAKASRLDVPGPRSAEPRSPSSLSIRSAHNSSISRDDAAKIEDYTRK